MGDQLAMTECNEQQLDFQPLGRRQVVGKFDGVRVTSDAGGLLLRETIQGTDMVKRLSSCFVDHRDPDLIAFTVKELLTQRISGLALGYEDLNDHDYLRRDPMFAILVGKSDSSGPVALAGKSTLNRLELTRNDDGRSKRITHCPDKIASLLTEVGLDGIAENGVPLEIWLDLDATDDPIHGEQEGKFFNGYYDHDCFMPLYFFAGHELLVARLRTSDCDPLEGVLEDVERVVRQIRERWPETKIFVRGDGGFCRDELMSWCESNGVDFVIGMATNTRLDAMITTELAEAKRLHDETGLAARVFADFRYQTLKTWDQDRRVVGKVEHLALGPNPRFVVTSIVPKEYEAKELYEDVYCARGNMENRIKEQQMGMFADRTSSHTLLANQLRLWFSSFAYSLVQRMRQVGLKGTSLERAQAWTIREKLFKMGATIAFSVRRVMFAISEGHPNQECFRRCLMQLQARYGFA
jgi:hypothetical protein